MGVKKIVEIKNLNKYYENIKYFIADAKEDVEKAKAEILSGRQKLSAGFSSEGALINVLNKRYNTQLVGDIIKAFAKT